MRHGFIKTAAATVTVKVADCIGNAEEICRLIEETESEGAKVVVFPELCITGYTCGDLFLQEILLLEARKALIKIADCTKNKDMIAFVGLPFEYEHKLYNAAAAVHGGRVIGIVPKSFLPNYAEFYEARYFVPGNGKAVELMFDGYPVLFGTQLLFQCEQMEGLTIAAEICEDLWTVEPPSIHHVLAGADLIVNLSASNETTGKEAYRRELVCGQSARLLCGYIYASAGEGESTTDVVYSGHNLIAENGIVLSESSKFKNQVIYADIDTARLRMERRRMSTFLPKEEKVYQEVLFSLKMEETKLSRVFPSAPFIPASKTDRESRCEEIIAIQSMGLKKRLKHTGCKSAVIGISGGLDSTLALLVTARAFDRLKISRSNIIAVTMPCFGTTNRTYQNALSLADCLGAELREVEIEEAVSIHFRDIGQEMENHDVTYENSQARERTQILMDIANQTGGMVIGTGDMSELALGWATYNGDHMSMYGVNASVPKTLVKHLVFYIADTCNDEKLKRVLLDILDTPVSPELLPPKDGAIAQKTEDIVGPYELHDFYLYYILRFGYEPEKIYRIAKLAFKGMYEDRTILKWMKVFYRRFFSQQFKRSCLPDGPKVGSVALSPRGDLRMPSDASAAVWLKNLENLH